MILMGFWNIQDIQDKMQGGLLIPEKCFITQFLLTYDKSNLEKDNKKSRKVWQVWLYFPSKPKLEIDV